VCVCVCVSNQWVVKLGRDGFLHIRGREVCLFGITVEGCGIRMRGYLFFF